MGRTLSKMFKEDKVDGGNILFKFLLEVRNFQTMPEELVWRMLYFGQEPPFSCDLSGFQGRTTRNSSARKRKDRDEQEVERAKTKPKRF